MRLLMYVRMPHAEFNAAVKDGSAGPKLTNILESNKPEAVYFTEHDGQRGAVIVVSVPDPSAIPALTEPWFLTFRADVQFRVAITPEEIAKSGLDKLGRKWA